MNEIEARCLLEEIQHIYSGTSQYSGPAKVAGLVRWLDLRETSLIQPYYDMAELAGLASFTQARA